MTCDHCGSPSLWTGCNKCGNTVDLTLEQQVIAASVALYYCEPGRDVTDPAILRGLYAAHKQAVDALVTAHQTAAAAVTNRQQGDTNAESTNRP